MSRTDEEKRILVAEVIDETRRTFEALTRIAEVVAEAFDELTRIWDESKEVLVVRD